MIFNRLFGAAKPAPVERSVYELIVAQARQPWFYAQLGVPDTVSGRFDMIVMHMFLVLERLSQGNDSDKAFSQALFDEMNRDMDRSLREMGASDVSVGKKVRKMAEVFYGRANAYREALAKPASADEAALVEALQRNLYAEEDSSEGATPLAHYIRRAQVVIAEVALDEISGGTVKFPDAEFAK